MHKLLLASGALLLSSNLFAFDGIDEKYRKTQPGDIYFGAMASVIKVDGFQEDAHSIGGTVGINVINKDFGTIAIDTFFSRTIDEAIDQTGAEADVNVAGIFAAYRTPTKLFGKAKVGVISTELDSPSSSGSNSEFAWGLGLGAEVYYGVDIELEFTQINDEVSSIGINFILHD